MRILVNARFLLKDKLEGIGLYTYEILRRLVINHPEDQFIFCFDRPYDDRFIFADNVEPVVIRPPARHPFLFIWWFQVAIPRLYRQKQADAFFSPDGFLSLSPKVKKSLLVIHDLAFIHYPLQVSPVVLWYYRKFVPRFIDKADHIVTVSEASREDIEKNYPSAMGKISVIYNGVRDYFKPMPLAEQIKTRDLYSGGNPYFIAVGAIHPRKNIERLLNAYQVFRQHNESSTRLIIVGRKAWKTGTVESIYLKHPYKDDILFLGYVADDILANLVGSSAGLLFISLFEGFGLPIVEAMRSEVPVITSNRSSMREVAGAAALLVDPEDVEDIALGMRSLDQDKEYCQTLIQRGKDRATMFDWDAAANQMSERLHLLNW